ncbi:phage holin family protein [Actinomadura monticuli]|uniref:Phage holin family protein n=1 Tax=Actinomadura monticuli TaxID=3097367 RepID=A0ABV4QEM9_9ACTN
MSEALPGERVEDKSVGELVAAASGSISDLIRAEMALAKMELKSDARKAAAGSVMITIATVMVSLIVIMLAFALAEWFIALGVPRALAFAAVAGVCLVLAIAMVVVALLVLKRIEGGKRTRKTLKDDFAALRRRGDSGELKSGKDGSGKPELKV